MVSHAGKEVVFDWSSSKKTTTSSGDDDEQPADAPAAAAIKWAAFYSDCEHEIRNVTAGSRVTLTYNLYVRCGSSSGGGSGNTEVAIVDQGLAPVDVQSLPLYQVLKDALKNPKYMENGECST